VLPPVAERIQTFDALVRAVVAFLAGYCRYMGERDFRFGE